MTTTETQELGTIYTLHANEASVQLDLGDEVRLASRDTKMGRRWFIQGDRGMVCFDAAAVETGVLADRWLAANGYTACGDLPPDCFDYRKAVTA